jgi:dihydroneopterin aldolase/2-amino-4-hydroxy-6-hydroxymethyldihydropteridine diphosphokinase
MDRITLRGIVANGRHGANPGERDADQPFEIDLVMFCDASSAARSDDLADTIDYARVHREIVEVVETHSYALLERLASSILDRIFSDPRIIEAELSVSKPKLLAGATPSITMVRKRNG